MAKPHNSVSNMLSGAAQLIQPLATIPITAVNFAKSPMGATLIAMAAPLVGAPPLSPSFIMGIANAANTALEITDSIKKDNDDDFEHTSSFRP